MAKNSDGPRSHASLVFVKSSGLDYLGRGDDRHLFSFFFFFGVVARAQTLDSTFDVGV